MSKSKFQIIYVWRVLLWLGLAAFLAWLFWQNLVPTGVVELRHVKGIEDETWRVADLHPKARLIDLKTDGNNQRFFGDPVYFDAKAPREFETVAVDISWQNQSQPILELGARKVRGEFGFVLKPLQNKIIDNLAQPHPNPLRSYGEGTQTWDCQQNAGLMFCQKVKRFKQLSDYLAQPTGKLVTYYFSPPAAVKCDIMNTETKIDNYDYLITTYEPPQILENNWFKRQVSFDWQDFALYINQISFIISAPKLQEGHGQIVVGDINVTLKRPPLDWPGFVEYVKNQLRRLKK